MKTTDIKWPLVGMVTLLSVINLQAQEKKSDQELLIGKWRSTEDS